MISSDTDQQPSLTIGMGLDAGQARQHKPNQDSVGIYSDYCEDAKWLTAKGRLFVVADGMGGASGGKEASEMAVEVVLDSYYEDSDLEIVPSLERAIQDANRQIMELGQADRSVRGLGTTIVSAVIRGRELVVANVGDSRAYLLRQGALQQLSLDHTSVQEQARAGLLTPEEAATHPRRHVLSRNLGARPRAQPDFATETLAEGDTLLLCSDGLWGPVSDQEIADLLQRLRGKAAADGLIKLANQHGGPDNISAIVVHVGESETANVQRTERRRTPPAGQKTVSEQPLPGAAAAKPSARRQMFRYDQLLLAAGTGVILLLLVILALRSPFFSSTEQLATSITSAPAQQAVAPSALPPSAQLAALPPTNVPTTVPPIVPTTIPTATPLAASTLLHRLEHKGSVRSVAFTPDGQTLASVSLDTTVKLWQVRDGKQLSSVVLEEDQAADVTSIALAPDGQILATGSRDGTIKLWRVGTAGGTTTPQPKPDSTMVQASVTALIASFGDETPIARTPSAIAANKPIHMLTQHTTAISYLAFSADGQMLASAAADGKLMLWKVGDGQLVAPLPKIAEGVTSLAFGPDGQSIAAGLANGEVKLWRIDGVPISQQELVGHGKPVTSIAFSPNGQILAVGSQDASVELWSLNGEDFTRLRTLTGHSHTLGNVVFAPDGRTLALTSLESTVELWRIDSGDLIYTFGNADSVTSVAFAPNGRMLATGSDRGSVMLWQVPDGVL